MLGPIFSREWLTVPRRSRHYVLRSCYLILLWALGITAWQATVGFEQIPTLGDTARFGLLFFQILAYVQLTLVLFFSALSGASSVTREKDRRTFILLLVSDLRNYEIVMGKFLGSLLQILLLLAGMVPVLAVIVLLGGVAPVQVVQAGLVLLATSLAAGALGVLMALWRDKTFPALALTVLSLVLYLFLVQLLAVVPPLISWVLGSSDHAADWQIESWQRWLDPFLAMQSVLEPLSETTVEIAPAYCFTVVMTALALLLNGWGILYLRVWNPSGEPVMQREKAEDAEAEEKDRLKAHAAPGAARPVGGNPILWREISTRAYGRRPFLVKAAYLVVLVLICYYALAPWWTASGRQSFFAGYGLVPVSILSLLLVSAQAVTAVTSERDTGALDLLLVTDLTPKEFIFGKLWGIAYNTKEFLLPPVLLAAFYAYNGLLATPPRGHGELLAYKNVEAFSGVALGTIVLLAFAAVLGIHVALRTETSQLAILNTLATVFFLSVGTLVCIYLILINGRFEYQWFSFIFFLAAGVGGLWWVLNGERPSSALGLASLACPLAVFYTVTNILVAKPGSEESTDPLLPFLVVAGAFGFTVTAMLVPLLAEFDVALGRTTGLEE